MLFSTLKFASLLSYSPRGISIVEQRSRTVMRNLKNDTPIKISSTDEKLTSHLISEIISDNITKLPFSDFFNTNTILVPVPNSSFMQPGTLWVPKRIADALVQNRLGSSVVELIQRVKPLRRSSTSSNVNRPKAIEHYNSIEVQERLLDTEEIILIDDVITRGATLLGIATKLANSYPNSRIRGFAVMRTISSGIVRNIYDPCIGMIKLKNDDTFRDP